MPLRAIDPARYEAQLAEKVARFTADFAPLGLPAPEIFRSAPLHYRLRAEFRIFHEGPRIHYAMFAPENPKKPVIIDDYPPGAPALYDLMPQLLAALEASNTLKDGLYEIHFHSTVSGDMMVSLVYRRPISPRWEAAARSLADAMNLVIIGRSRGKKIVLSRDWVEECVSLEGRTLYYQQFESAFSQPNGGVNQHMLAWACRQVGHSDRDLLELYCGNGNFTMALAPHFPRVVATEVSKTSVRAAQHNAQRNGITNVDLLRISSEDLSAAMAEQGGSAALRALDLRPARFSTLLVDPPRSGLDAGTLELARQFDQILYISCNPETLLANVHALSDTHEIRSSAVFDQFPYTHHLEAGVMLVRKTR